MARRPASTLRKDKFRQRNRTLTKKADELAKIPGAKVYCVVLFHGQFYTYTSQTTKAWPPSHDEIVSKHFRGGGAVMTHRQVGTKFSAPQEHRASRLPDNFTGLLVSFRLTQGCRYVRCTYRRRWTRMLLYNTGRALVTCSAAVGNRQEKFESASGSNGSGNRYWLALRCLTSVAVCDRSSVSNLTLRYTSVSRPSEVRT